MEKLKIYAGAKYNDRIQLTIQKNKDFLDLLVMLIKKFGLKTPLTNLLNCHCSEKCDNKCLFHNSSMREDRGVYYSNKDYELSIALGDKKLILVLKAIPQKERNL